MWLGYFVCGFLTSSTAVAWRMVTKPVSGSTTHDVAMNGVEAFVYAYLAQSSSARLHYPQADVRPDIQLSPLLDWLGRYSETPCHAIHSRKLRRNRLR